MGKGETMDKEKMQQEIKERLTKARAKLNHSKVVYIMRSKVTKDAHTLALLQDERNQATDNYNHEMAEIGEMVELLDGMRSDV